MERREVLRLLGSAAAISALPLEAMTLIQNASAQVAQSGGLRTLNPHQNATVTTIAELIIPATDTPGATGAKVNEFIDLLLTEWYEPSETKQLDAAAMEFSASQKRTMQTHGASPPMNFFYQMKKLTLAGYYTSEIGFSQELGKSIIPPAHAGCAPVEEPAR
jgi:hypothetical protein